MCKKIVLGLGNNVDYEIHWNSTVLEQHIRKLNIYKNDIKQPKLIDSMRQLLISILCYMQNGTGGERHSENINDLLNFSQHFRYKITLGGTAVRAAIVLDKLGFSSYVHLVANNEETRQLLPVRTFPLYSSDKESFHPHLIIQYPAGSRVCANDISIVTERANRLIYTNDPDNETMRIHPDLGTYLKVADVFLISGFNAIQKKSVLRRCLDELLQAMENLPLSAIVFYEDACFHNRELSSLVHQTIGNRVNIHSMNEDELKNYIDLTPSLLSPEGVYRAVKKLQQRLRISYLMVHSRFWALIAGSNASIFREALKNGVTMATTRFRKGDAFNNKDYLTTTTFLPEIEAMEFCERFNTLYEPDAVCVPSLAVTTKDITTIGLGDAYTGGFLATFLDKNLQNNLQQGVFNELSNQQATFGSCQSW